MTDKWAWTETINSISSAPIQKDCIKISEIFLAAAVNIDKCHDAGFNRGTHCIYLFIYFFLPIANEIRSKISLTARGANLSSIQLNC